MPDNQPARSTRDQHKLIADALIRLGADTRKQRLTELSSTAGRPVPAFADLSFTEATAVILQLGIRLGQRQQEASHA